MLPIRTTADDIEVICGYLLKKPVGATIADAKAVLDGKYLDGRKLGAMRYWGILEENGERLRLTERGRAVIKDGGAKRKDALLAAVRSVNPYVAAIERAAHKKDVVVTATDVAVHWTDHFPDQVSESEKIINDQAVCFFNSCKRPGLGDLCWGGKDNRLVLNSIKMKYVLFLKTRLTVRRCPVFPDVKKLMMS